MHIKILLCLDMDTTIDKCIVFLIGILCESVSCIFMLILILYDGSDMLLCNGEVCCVVEK